MKGCREGIITAQNGVDSSTHVTIDSLQKTAEVCLGPVSTQKGVFNMRGVAVTVLLGGLLAMALPQATMAQGEPLPTLMVLPVDGDDLPAAEKAALVTELRGIIAKYKKYTVMETAKIDLLDEMVEFECLDMDSDCIGKIGAKQKASTVLYTRAEKGKLVMMTVESASAKTLQKFESPAAKGEVKAIATGKGLVALMGELPQEAPKLIKVTVSANVEKAEVLLNGSKAGETPLSLELKPGEYTVTIKKETYLIWEEKVKVTADKPATVTAQLKPVPKPKEPVVVVTPPVDKPKDDKKVADKQPVKEPVKEPVPTDKPKGDDEASTPFYATWWFWTAVGAATVAIVGITAAAVSASGDSYDVGPLRLSINPSAAENDGIFYE